MRRPSGKKDTARAKSVLFHAGSRLVGVTAGRRYLETRGELLAVGGELLFHALIY